VSGGRAEAEGGNGSIRDSNQRNMGLFLLRSCLAASPQPLAGANPFSFLMDRAMRYPAIVPKRWLEPCSTRQRKSVRPRSTGSPEMGNAERKGNHGRRGKRYRGTQANGGGVVPGAA